MGSTLVEQTALQFRLNEEQSKRLQEIIDGTFDLSAVPEGQILDQAYLGSIDLFLASQLVLVTFARNVIKEKIDELETQIRGTKKSIDRYSATIKRDN